MSIFCSLIVILLSALIACCASWWLAKLTNAKGVEGYFLLFLERKTSTTFSSWLKSCHNHDQDIVSERLSMKTVKEISFSFFPAKSLLLLLVIFPMYALSCWWLGCRYRPPLPIQRLTLSLHYSLMLIPVVFPHLLQILRSILIID